MLRITSVTFRCLLLLLLSSVSLYSRAQDTSTARKPVTAEDFYAAGEDYFNQKDFPKAISMLAKAVHLNPRHAAAYNCLATCFLQSGGSATPENYTRAKSYLQKAITINPAYWNPYANLIQANIDRFTATNDSAYLKEAVTFSMQARQYVPADQTGSRYYISEASLYRLTGDIYMEQKSLGEYLYHDSLNQAGYKEQATERLVYNLLGLGKIEDAKLTLTKYGAEPAIKKYNLLLGIIHYNLGDPGTALKYIDLYIEKNAEDPEGRYYRGHCYLKQNRRAEAKAEFQFCLSKQYRVQDVNNWIKETETRY